MPCCYLHNNLSYKIHVTKYVYYFYLYKGREYGGVGAAFWLYAILSVRAVTNITTAYNKPQSSWELRCYGLLRSEWWSFLTDSSGQPCDPIFSGQEPIGHQGSGPLTRRISCARKVGKELPLLSA